MGDMRRNHAHCHQSQPLTIATHASGPQHGPHKLSAVMLNAGGGDVLLQSASGGSLDLLVQYYTRDGAASGSIEPDTLALAEDGTADDLPRAWAQMPTDADVTPQPAMALSELAPSLEARQVSISNDGWCTLRSLLGCDCLQCHQSCQHWLWLSWPKQLLQGQGCTASHEYGGGMSIIVSAFQSAWCLSLAYATYMGVYCIVRPSLKTSAVVQCSHLHQNTDTCVLAGPIQVRAVCCCLVPGSSCSHDGRCLAHAGA